MARTSSTCTGETPDTISLWKLAEHSVKLERLQKLGNLYFIQCGGYVKIGRTTNIVRRLANMQTNTPHTINCLALLSGRGHEEPLWHEAFSDYVERGEWYRFNNILLKAIEKARAGEDWWDHVTMPCCVDGDPDDDDDIVDWHISLMLRQRFHYEQVSELQRITGDR